MSSSRKARKAGCFDEHGLKIPSPNSPIREGSRTAGPPGDAPRWRDSVILAWRRVERRDSIRRWRAEHTPTPESFAEAAE